MEVYTDNFGDLGTNYLDTYVYGLTEAVLTAGGPIIPSYKNLRFFLAGSGIVQQSPARYWEGMHYEDVYDPARGAAVWRRPGAPGYCVPGHHAVGLYHPAGRPEPVYRQLPFRTAHC